MTTNLETLFVEGKDLMLRALAGDSDHGDGHGDDHGLGVHVSYSERFDAIIFLFAIYVGGLLSQKLLKMPSLVGEIFAGIILGPPVLDYVPNPSAWVLLGEIGLILLVLEAGIDINLTTLKLIGARGVIIAVVGCGVPIAIGIGIAFAFGQSTTSAIAAGCAFGPTSLGIALNVLRSGKIVNTPVGQLIVSAAVIDDMIALMVLSLLEALTGEFSIKGIVFPVVFSVVFLGFGGFAAIFVFPVIIEDYILPCVPAKLHAKASLGLMLLLMIGLMPACHYLKTSYLLGVFISGLTFAKDHEVHHLFGVQFKRLLQWLMRIFFAGAIGFQVPIKTFGDAEVIWKGIVFTVAILGKLTTGFFVPNFSNTPYLKGNHLRDVLLTGFSMAAEGEIAFVIAVFAQSNGIISEKLYASIVLAIMISTIIPPFILRYTINTFNKRSEVMIKKTVKFELKKSIIPEDLESSDHDLATDIKEGIAVFLCAQIQCESRWGLLPAIMAQMKSLKLQVIDHRSWHPPRGKDSTLVNEIYAEGSAIDVTHEEFLSSIEEALVKLIGQSDARIRVTRWHPGVETQIIEEVDGGVASEMSRRLSVSAEIMNEAQALLEKKQFMQENATQEKTMDEILKGAIVIPESSKVEEAPPRRKVPRVRTLSTPVIGGDMFASKIAAVSSAIPVRPPPPPPPPESSSPPGSPQNFNAQLTVSGETFQIQLSSSAIAKVRKGRGITARDLKIDSRNSSLHDFNLDGFIRKNLLPPVAEEDHNDGFHGKLE